MPRHQPPYLHGWQRYTTVIAPITTNDIAPFGTYPSYLAARLEGLKAARGLSRFEAYVKYADLVEGDGDGDETAKIGPIGNVVSPNAGALRETPVELWGNETRD